MSHDDGDPRFHYAADLPAIQLNFGLIFWMLDYLSVSRHLCLSIWALLVFFWSARYLSCGVSMTSDDSFIVSKKDDLDLTLRSQNAHALSEFLDQPAVTIAETITGALAEGNKGVIASAGRLVQGALKCQLLTQFAREIKYFQEKGRI